MLFLIKVKYIPLQWYVDISSIQYNALNANLSKLNCVLAKGLSSGWFYFDRNVRVAKTFLCRDLPNSGPTFARPFSHLDKKKYFIGLSLSSFLSLHFL